MDTRSPTSINTRLSERGRLSTSCVCLSVSFGIRMSVCLSSSSWCLIVFLSEKSLDYFIQTAELFHCILISFVPQYQARPSTSSSSSVTSPRYASTPHANARRSPAPPGQRTTSAARSDSSRTQSVASLRPKGAQTRWNSNIPRYKLISWCQVKPGFHITRSIGDYEIRFCGKLCFNRTRTHARTHAHSLSHARARTYCTPITYSYTPNWNSPDS